MSHRYLFLVLMVACAAAAPSLTSAAQTQPSVSRQIFIDADLNKDGFVDLEEFHKDALKRLRLTNGKGTHCPKTVIPKLCPATRIQL